MITKKSDTHKKLPVLLAAGAMFAPLLNPITAQAQPRAQAPDSGYYKDKNGRNQRRDILTLTGVVTRNLAGNEFSFRANDGRTFRVVTRNAEPNWISAGDRVEVRGWRDGDLFVAENVRPINNNNAGGNQSDRLSLTGVITQLRSRTEFNFRANDGRTFRVVTRIALPAGIVANDRVVVKGWRDRNDRDVIHADSIVDTRADANQGERMSLTGVVTQNLTGNDFYFRAADGRRFRVQVRSSDPLQIAVNDRVEVKGWRDRNERDVIHADSVQLLSQRGSSAGQRVNLRGTVIRLRSQSSLDLRGDDGRTYSVTSSRNFSTRISNGDRVRVVGRSTSTTAIVAENVALVSDNNAGGNNGTSVNFPGRVESVNNNGLVRNLRVRGDNGQMYNVQYRNLQTFQVGDRVRVIGTFNNGVVNATSIAML